MRAGASTVECQAGSAGVVDGAVRPPRVGGPDVLKLVDCLTPGRSRARRWLGFGIRPGALVVCPFVKVIPVVRLVGAVVAAQYQASQGGSVLVRPPFGPTDVRSEDLANGLCAGRGHFCRR